MPDSGATARPSIIEPVTETTTRLAIVVMGVSGCGKTTLGTTLANHLACPFLEGDAYHPPGNVNKMRRGTPLTDQDRRPWLHAIAAAINAQPATRVVATCSALKRRYRDTLRERVDGPLRFIWLDVPRSVLVERLAARRGHFMPPALLDSQLADLEAPTHENDVLCFSEGNLDSITQYL